MSLSAVGNLIPNPFGGFAPFPNSIMIPFMGTQSAVLGYDFGLSYEAGKRMIKSMDNEDFNKFIKKGDTVEFEGKQQNLLSVFSKQHYRTMIKQFTDLIPDALELQNTIIQASVAIELRKANRTPSAVAEIMATYQKAIDEEIRLGHESVKDWFNRTFGTDFNVTPSQDTSFENTGVKEPEPPEPFAPTTSPTSPTPTTTPEEPFVAPEITAPAPEPASVYPYSFTFHKTCGTCWDYFHNKPIDKLTPIIFKITSHDYAHSLIVAWTGAVAEGVKSNTITNTDKNVMEYNIFTLRQKHFQITKHAL